MNVNASDVVSKQDFDLWLEVLESANGHLKSAPFVCGGKVHFDCEFPSWTDFKEAEKEFERLKKRELGGSLWTRLINKLINLGN